MRSLLSKKINHLYHFIKGLTIACLSFDLPVVFSCIGLIYKLQYTYIGDNTLRGERRGSGVHSI